MCAFLMASIAVFPEGIFFSFLVFLFFCVPMVPFMAAGGRACGVVCLAYRNDVTRCGKPDTHGASFLRESCFFLPDVHVVPVSYAKRFVAYTSYDVSVDADGM